MNRCLVAVILWLGAGAGAGAAVAADESPGEDNLSRYHRTALALQDAAPNQRADFATVALGELVAVYMAESDLARNEAGEARDDSKLLGWSAAVDRFASQLLLVLDDVDQGFPVEIDLRRQSYVAIQAGGRLVMLTHPRLAQQHAFEQRTLADFCSRTDCAALTAERELQQPIPLYSGSVRPGWSFTEQGPVCSHEGILVQFSSAEHLARLRDICQQFFQETNTLLTEIAWQRIHGATIEWQALEISPTPGQPEHFMRLNNSGDSVLVTLPLLYAGPELLQTLVPWLRDRSEGGQPGLLIDGDQWYMRLDGQ